jgi:hypothetical protein
VLVETGLLLAGSSDLGRDRFAAARAVLARADRVVVLAGADGEGAIRLVNWLSAATSVGVGAPIWAVFSPTRSSYEEAQLAELLSDHGVAGAFAAVHFLPEDPAVAKAKWNRDLVRHGRWLAAVRRLAAEMVACPPTDGPADRSTAAGGGQRPQPATCGERGELGVMSAYEMLRDTVHDRIRALDLDPEHRQADSERIRAIVEAAIEEYQLRDHAVVGLQPLSDPDDMRDRLLRLVSSRTGPLGPAIDNPEVVEIHGRATPSWSASCAAARP